MGQIYYRADKRNFAADETIPPIGEFAELHKDIGKEMEDLLERRRPDNKPVRCASLFLFEELEAAKEYWSKMTGGLLYEVEADPGSIRHRGDMELTGENGRSDVRKIRQHWQCSTGAGACLTLRKWSYSSPKQSRCDWLEPTRSAWSTSSGAMALENSCRLMMSPTCLSGIQAIEPKGAALAWNVLEAGASTPSHGHATLLH
jgi:hypothetical protein